MLKIPGVKDLNDFTYSIGITNNDSVMLTIKYLILNNYNYKIVKIKVLEFFPDQRCGNVNLLYEILEQAMKNALVGKTKFSYFESRMYIYLYMTFNKRRINIWCSQFTGNIY